ncbi:MAG: YdeI/OmpD-associated family protein [Pseudomonadota bacterium]
MAGAGIEQVEVASAHALGAWLAAEHARETGVWLVTFKKSVPEKYVSREAVLDELLRFGWVDGRRKVLDARRTQQLVAPRRTEAWAQTYKDRAARLIVEGRMEPAGLAAIEASKAAGLWDYWADVDALIDPPDLVDALQARPGAAAWWIGAAPSYRRNVLRWIKLAKTDATRAKRLSAAAGAAAAGTKLPQM